MAIRIENLDTDSLYELEEELIGVRGVRRKKVKKKGPTKSDKRQVENSLNKRREEKSQKAQNEIRKVLSRFGEPETPEGQTQIKRYLNWLNHSLWITRKPYLEQQEQDIEFKSFLSGKAGGQHRDRKATAVRLIHKPTLISTTVEEERSQSQNREKGLGILKFKLSEHYEAWTTFIDNSNRINNKRDLEKEVFRLASNDSDR